MDHSSNTSPRSLPTPRSPAPMALSEFMAQTTPCSDTTSPSDKPPLTPDILKLESVELPKQAPVQDNPRSETPQQQPQETQTEETQPRPSTSQDNPPPQTDWLATRQQLLPRRNQGKKADWIRGWSDAVSSHGEETYCACSETVERSNNNRGRKGKASAQLADNVRAILSRASSPSLNKNKNTTTPVAPSSPEPQVCRTCSRPPSPPESTATGATNPTSNKGTSAGGEGGGGGGGGGGGSSSNRSFGKRFSELLMRVRPSSRSRSKSGGGAAAAGLVVATSSKRDDDAEMRQLAAWLPRSRPPRPEGEGEEEAEEKCQPRWATTGPGQKRFLATTAAAAAAAAAAPRPLSSSQLASAQQQQQQWRQKSWGGGGGAVGYTSFVGSSGARGRRMTPNNRAAAAAAAAATAVGPSSSELEDGMSDSDPRWPRLSRSMSRLQRAAAMLQRATTRSKD